ncbi:MAG: HigA family addiction module antidote protein [Desulfobulbaceae bacterium]|nr:HigA family addiction module antidote protein [Desulfobulbaceae bacterium]
MLPKKRPNHPGEFIKEDVLKELLITSEQLAKAIDVAPETIARLIDGKERISADMALRLSKFTRTAPQMWMSLQATIDLWDAYNSPDFEKIKKIKPYNIQETKRHVGRFKTVFSSLQSKHKT